MSDIALYNLFKRIPDATDDEVEKAIADVASTKEVTTKADLETGLAKLETRLIEKMSEQEARLTKLIYAVVAINTGIIIAAVGLMLNFL